MLVPKLFQRKSLVCAFREFGDYESAHVSHDALFFGLVFSLLHLVGPLVVVLGLRGVGRRGCQSPGT